MATTKNVAHYLNKIPCNKTRQAVQKVFELLVADNVTNAAVFAAHTHDSSASAETTSFTTTLAS